MGEHVAKRFNSGSKGKGGFMQASLSHDFCAGGKSYGKNGGKNGGKSGKHRDEDPVGSGRVFVRGFDFGTDDEQFEGHMSTVGSIHKVHWVTRGSAVVVYQEEASAVQAVSQLSGTTIAGNSRYIDVILKDH